MSKSNQIQLSDHFTTGRLLKFTASPIIMMIFTSIYTIVDGFFVSNCAGKTAFTALNLIYPYLQMLGCLGFMIGTGGSALVAMTLGMGDEKRANRLFSMLAVATVGIGAIFSVIGLALLRPVALLLGATPELLPSCLLYGRILLTFQTAFMLQYLFQSFFIAAEKPKLGLFFTVAAGVTNMVLDFVLVGVAGLGLAGAASATVISQMVGGVAPIFYFAKRRPGCRLYFTKPLFSLRELFKACTNGISELMTNISMSLVGALYNMQLLKLFGADGVAAYGVLMYVGFVFAAVFIGGTSVFGGSGRLYCSWWVVRQLCEETYGGLTLDSLSAAMADNRKIGEFWDGYASRYFVAPTKDGTPVPWEGSRLYRTYPFALAVYDDVLVKTVEQLQQNQRLLGLVSWLLGLASFGVGAVFSILLLRHRSRELKLQFILGQSRGSILVWALTEHGILSLLGVIIGAGGFWLAFRTAPAWGPVAGFWVMNLAGTALAYLLTMRRKFLESNLGRE